MLEGQEIVDRLAAIRERIKRFAAEGSPDALQAVYDQILALELDLDPEANSADAPSFDNVEDVIHSLQSDQTIEEAAAFLNVSRAYIIKLIEMCELAVTIRAADLQAWEEAQRQRSDDAMRRFSEQAKALGLDDD